MKPLFEDTSPPVEAAVIRRLREMTPAERLAQLVSLNQASQALALSRIRPTYPDREVALRLGSLWLDRETTIRVFDWDPRRMGY